MRITTKAVFDMETMTLLEWEGYEYSGPVDLAGGGASAEQKQAAASEAANTAQATQTSKDMLGIYKDQYSKINPYETNIMNNGLPYYSALSDYNKGTTAQSFQPAYAALNRRMSSFGALPSGFRTQATTDLDAQRARAFDANQVNYMNLNQTAKSNAAAALTGQQAMANPLGWNQAVTSGNQSIMQAPLASPGIGGILGGAAGGAMSALAF